MQHRELALEIAHELGFDLAGIAPLAPPPDAARFDSWLEAGHGAGMDWLAGQAERIRDPRKVLPEGRSMLVVGVGHSRPPVELGGGGRIARYAAGRDYHNWIGKRLKKLARRLDQAGLAGPWRGITDAGPILERSHAAGAGLGFASKAANLLHPTFGPWFFLGELLLGEDLEPTTGPPPGSCGSCTACLDVCPTGAIREPGLVHAPDCISYLTIEHRGSIAEPLREQMGEWAFGCDLCSEVCPWGRKAPDLAERFGTHRQVQEGDLVSWLAPEREMAVDFEGSPLRRPGREGLARNAAIVLGNRPRDEGRVALLQVLREDPSPIVREAAAWGLERGHAQDAGVADALDAAARRGSIPQRSDS